MNKFFKTITLFVLIILSQNALAQIDSPYLADSLAGTTITLLPKREIYLPNQQQASTIQQAARNNYYFTHIYDLSFCKAKRFSKQTDLQLCGFCKTKASIDYDTYMVLYKGVLYFVRPEDVLDNTILEEKNQGIREWYQRLLDEQSSIQYEYDAQLQKMREEITAAKKDIAYREAHKEELTEALYRQRLSEKLDPMEESYRVWYEGLTPVAQKTADIIAVNDLRLYSPNSAGGCDVHLEFTNMSQKEIKYLDWTANIYNAVNDKVACSIRGTYTFSGRVTGPLAYKQIFEGNWENTIYNYSAESVRFTKVVITYMDGTKKTLSGAEFSAVIGAPKCSIHEFQRRFIEEDAAKVFPSYIYRDKQLWENREHAIEHIEDNKYPPYGDAGYFERAFELKKQLAEKNDEVAKFEDRNFIKKKQ